MICIATSALALGGMVREKDLLHDVFAKVKLAPVCPLEFQERHGRRLVHENVGSL